jgi:hypothetical protein
VPLPASTLGFPHKICEFHKKKKGSQKRKTYDDNGDMFFLAVMTKLKVGCAYVLVITNF